MKNKHFKILAIDGGGIRGVVPAHIIHRVHSEYGIIPSKYFDMIAGTSTGAIIAAALACEIEPSKIIALYKEHGIKIFKKKKSFWPNFIKRGVHSLYVHDELKKLLKDIFGDKKLGDVKIPLLLPSTDIGNGSVHIFKSGYSSNFTRDTNVFVRDAVIASCSAPTYFDPYMLDEKYLLSDGGLWANNPALTATIEAIHRQNIPPSLIRVFSVGTGISKTYYQSANRWGLFTGWKLQSLISFILSLQSQAAHNHLSLMLRETQLLRLNFESDGELPLDDVFAVDRLISKADMIFTKESTSIKSYLELNYGDL